MIGLAALASLVVTAVWLQGVVLVLGLIFAVRIGVICLVGFVAWTVFRWSVGVSLLGVEDLAE